MRLIWSACPLVAFATACSSGSTGGTHGPVFNLDGGGDVVVDHPPDSSLRDTGSADAAADRRASDTSSSADSSHHDAHVEAGGDSGHDAARADTSTDAAADVTLDAPSDVKGAADASVCPSGLGTIALVGGTSTVSFGATSKNGGAWAVASFGSSSVHAAPAVIAFNGGFLSVFPTATTAIQSTLFTTSWSTPANIPAIGDSANPALENGAPSLASGGASSAHLVYQGSDDKFYHGVYSGGAWGPADDPVGGAGASQGFGPSAPAAAAVGTTLYAANDGSNSGLYVDALPPGAPATWGAAAAITGAGVGGVPPTMVALTGGSFDLMLVYEAKTSNTLYSTVHTAGAGGGTWSTPLEVAATANTASAVSLAPLAGGGAVLVYLGTTNSFPYFSVYGPLPTPAWTTPAEIYPGSLPLASAPSVAAGTCGVDAVAVGRATGGG